MGAGGPGTIDRPIERPPKQFHAGGRLISWHGYMIAPVEQLAGYDDDDEKDDQDSSTSRAVAGEGQAGSGSGSVSFRRVTAICYLRGRGSPWQPREGGALRLYPPVASKTDREVSSSDSKVVLKFASQLGLSEKGDPQERQQQPAIGTGASCGGRDEDKKESDPLPAPPCVVGVGGDADGADEAVEGGDTAGETEDGQRQEFLDIAPLAGRAVVFLSGAVEHEVLPVTGSLPRAALTTWFH